MFSGYFQSSCLAILAYILFQFKVRDLVESALPHKHTCQSKQINQGKHCRFSGSCQEDATATVIVLQPSFGHCSGSISCEHIDIEWTMIAQVSIHIRHLHCQVHGHCPTSCKTILRWCNSLLDHLSMTALYPPLDFLCGIVPVEWFWDHLWVVSGIFHWLTMVDLGNSPDCGDSVILFFIHFLCLSDRSLLVVIFLFASGCLCIASVQFQSIWWREWITEPKVATFIIIRFLLFG